MPRRTLAGGNGPLVAGQIPFTLHTAGHQTVKKGTWPEKTTTSVDRTETPAWITFADTFNLTVPFVDRHVAEGRADKVVARWADRTLTFGALAENVPKEMSLASDEPEVAAGKAYAKYDETDTGTNVALTTAYIVVWGFWKQTEGKDALS